MTLSVKEVVARFDRMVRSQGGSLEMLDDSGPGRLRVRYRLEAGADPETCALDGDCTLGAGDLRAMIAEVLKRNGNDIDEIEILTDAAP